MSQAKPYIIPFLLVGVLILCYFPALELLVKKWEASEDYTHAFFVVPIIMYMIWEKRKILVTGQGNVIAGIILVILSLLFYLLSLQTQIPTFIFLSLLFFVVSGFVYISGFRCLRHLVTPIMLMVMVIPIPNQILATVTASLQLNISKISEIIIRLFSVPMLREGNILHIQDISFQVVDACSGIRSLISMTTLSLIIGYFTLTKAISRGLLFFLSFPVAIAINIVRVVGLILAYHFFQLDLAEGTLHTITGLVLFVLGLMLLFSFQRGLELWEAEKTNN